MARLCRSWIAGFALLLTGAAVVAQDPMPQTGQPPAQKAPEPAKAAEPRQSNNPLPIVSYTLAAIGTIVVMVLVCMPARRE